MTWNPRLEMDMPRYHARRDLFGDWLVRDSVTQEDEVNGVHNVSYRFPTENAARQAAEKANAYRKFRLTASSGVTSSFGRSVCFWASEPLELLDEVLIHAGMIMELNQQYTTVGRFFLDVVTPDKGVFTLWCWDIASFEKFAECFDQASKWCLSHAQTHGMTEAPESFWEKEQA